MTFPFQGVIEAAACLGISLNLNEKERMKEDKVEKVKTSKKKLAANNGAAKMANMAPHGVANMAPSFGVANMAIFAARTSSSSLSTMLRPGGDEAEEEKFKMDIPSENVETGEKRFSCQFCAKTFLMKVGLRKHKLKMHPGQQSDGDIACEFCPSLFNKSHMFKHMIAKHPLEVTSAPGTEAKVEKVVVEEKISLPMPTTTFLEIKARCQFCPKAFAGDEFLEKHIAAKHPEKVITEKDKELVTEFQCDQCQKYLGSKGALRNHMPLHFEEKPFKCESCGKEFSQSGNLRVHVKRYHPNQENESIDIWSNVTTEIVGNITI